MKTFDNFPDAFDYCRKADKPVRIKIDGDGEFKIYPSGRAVHLTRVPPQVAIGQTLCWPVSQPADH